VERRKRTSEKRETRKRERICIELHSALSLGVAATKEASFIFPPPRLRPFLLLPLRLVALLLLLHLLPLLRRPPLISSLDSLLCTGGEEQTGSSTGAGRRAREAAMGGDGGGGGGGERRLGEGAVKKGKRETGREGKSWKKNLTFLPLLFPFSFLLFDSSKGSRLGTIGVDDRCLFSSSFTPNPNPVTPHT
jgi:hypothetical protein